MALGSHDGPRALVISQEPQHRTTIERVMSAARYEVHSVSGVDELGPQALEDYSLLVLAASSLDGELGERLRILREPDDSGRPPIRIAVINESSDRRVALETIVEHRADHLLSSDSNDLLFVTMSKLRLEDYFGLEKYLQWGVQKQAWSVTHPGDKPIALDGVKALATEVRTHPRITDLLLAAVDEMIINALYRPESATVETSASRPVMIECGSDGRFLGIAVIDQHGQLRPDDLFRGIRKALDHEPGLTKDAPSASLGFRLMLTNLSHLVVNVDPGRTTEIIGLVDLRKWLKDYRISVPTFGMFVNHATRA